MEQTLILSFGWALLHSIWQIGLLGLCTLGLERLLRNYTAQIRHQLLLFLLGGMVLACGVTLFQEWQHFAQVQHLAPNWETGQLETNTGFVNSPQSSPLQPSSMPLLQKCKNWVESHLLWLVLVWMLGTLYFSLRFGWNYWALQGLRKQSAALQEPQLLVLVEKIQVGLGLQKKVRFYVHPSLGSPLTFGHFRPVILLPAALLCQTSPDLLEALLRHELIHIRRADFLVNLLLSVVQILFFYHPMIWVITRRIQELREEACDADVLDSGCNKLVYAEALLRLQKLNNHQNIPLVMQAQNHPSHFAKRVKQILRQAKPSAAPYSLVPQSWLGAGLGLALVIILSITALAAPKKQAPTPTPIVPTKPIALDIPQSEVKPIELPGPKVTPEVPKQRQTLKQVVTPPIDTPPAKPASPVLKMVTLRDKTLFLGENNISVTVSGVLAEQIKLSSTNIFIDNMGQGQFKAYANKIGKVVIKVTTPDYYWDVEFMVILPDPVAVLNGAGIIGGEIPVSSIRESKGIDPKLPPLSSDYAEVKCEILGFNCIYIPKEKDPIQITNPGGLFTPKALDQIQTVNVNDQIIFDNIRAKCPGDDKGRKINNVAFKIVADPEKKE